MNDALERTEVIQANTAIATESEAKAIFKKRMHEYVYTNFNEGEEQKKYRLDNIYNKTELIVSTLTARNPSIEFYKTILHSPADVFYQQLETRSTNSLVEEFENRFILNTMH